MPPGASIPFIRAKRAMAYLSGMLLPSDQHLPDQVIRVPRKGPLGVAP